MKEKDLNIQVLVATMFQNDFSKIDKMKITTDVVFSNQSDVTDYHELKFKNHKAQMFSTQTRGVGINRNYALSHATKGILLLADDDMVYHDGYDNVVRNAFIRHPDADAIIFNVNVIGGIIKHRRNKKSSRVHIYNALNYGVVRLAIRCESIKKNRICFSTCFGGGTIYSCGEDSLFIRDMLQKGMRIYTSSDVIATVDASSSTWFEGYTPKYIYDKGALFAALFGKFYLPFCVQYLLRHKEVYKFSNMNMRSALKLMKRGGEGYKTLTSWDEEKYKS